VLEAVFVKDQNAAGGASPHLLQASAIDKSFGTTHALDHVDLTVGEAEIVGLMGGNGAGKSTLAKIVGGLLSPDSGEMVLFGKHLDQNHSPESAMAMGLRFVHQELSLCANLTVFENFAIELPDVITGLRWKSSAISFAENALATTFPAHGIDPRATVGSLSLAQQQMVEITRAVSHPAARLVILDEPTSSLGSREAEQLKEFMKRRRQSGMSFIFVSHRLQETLDLADRIAVLRNGRNVWMGPTPSISRASLIEMLGGRRSADTAGHPPSDTAGRGVSVDIDRLSTRVLRDVKLQAFKGEILGLAGLEGSGQRDLLHAIFHAARSASDRVTIQGTVAFVSGDRKAEGTFPLWSINENITISSLRRTALRGFLSLSRLNAIAREWFERLKIRAPSGEAPITSLSGGNQQKAVIARALASTADIILLDDPTRGVDLGTKAELYGQFRAFAEQGRTLIWYSTDDMEFEECDRTLVFRDGVIAAEFDRAQATAERVIAASFHDAGGAAAGEARTFGKGRSPAIAALLPLLSLLAVLVPSIALNPLVVSPLGLTLVFGAALALSFAAISQLFIIAAGDIDLGLGTFIGLANVIAATWLVTDPLLAVLCFMAMLAAYPLLGLFIDARQIPAIIVTLGLSFVWLGLASLRLPHPGGSAPDWLVGLLKIKLFVVPVPILLCLLPALIAYVILFVWRYGTVLRGFGGHPRSIEAAGWSTRAAKASLYFFSGLFAVLAGIVVTASTRGGDPTGSTSMTLLSVAAVILGGGLFSGGVVAPIGALFGALTLVFVGMLLSLLGVNAVYLPMVQGLLLLGAVAMRTLVSARSTQ